MLSGKIPYARPAGCVVCHLCDEKGLGELVKSACVWAAAAVFSGQSHVSFRFVSMFLSALGMNRGLLKTDFLFETAGRCCCCIPIPSKNKKGKPAVGPRLSNKTERPGPSAAGAPHLESLKADQKSQSHGPTDSSDQPTRG